MSSRMSSSSRRSSSPFSAGNRRPPTASSSSSSSSYLSAGRLVPRSSPCSVSSHFYGGGGSGGSRSTTPGRRGSSAVALPPEPVPFPDADELVIEDTSRSGDSISVTIRFRPLSEREFQRGDEISWYPDGDRLVRCEYNPATAYAYDRVFGPSTTTEAVYDVAARPVVKGAMEGINGTVFAYGVTSSGKTHTMHGDHNCPGIIPLAIKDVFSMIQDTPGREFLLRVSYLEIYNEVINDLLDPTGQNLRVREDAQGTYVEGIKEEVVLSPGHALSFIAAGEEHRHVGSNNFNLFSSRSHTIFTMMIESSSHSDEYDGVMYSQLNLIDLAGSESSKTETTGIRRKEGSYINKSLLTLGTVIGKLSEGRATHIPYRDSKLTRLLQSSLSGHGHVSLICTITPASSNMEETHNTLKFASRAKRVEIYASRNRMIDEKSLIKKYQREISSLKQELDQLRRGMIGGASQEEIMILRQKLEEGQVKMQSRLEEEEEAKAALMSRIQRLTKLILVSTKNNIPALTDSHQRHNSVNEEDKLSTSQDSSTLVQNEGTTKDSPSSALTDPLDEISHLRSASGEHSSVTGSASDSMQAGFTASDQMDLLIEQVKMLAGEVAFGTSSLKRLIEQSIDDPEGTKDQIENLEREIQQKRRHMRALEQQIMASGEASVANASMVDMQQTIAKLTAQCSEKTFELELKSADNRVLQEQLQLKNVEINDLQEKVLRLEQQLSVKVDISPEQCTQQEIIDLKYKLQSKEAESENLKYEHLKVIEEHCNLVNQNHKLSEETAYAKELASSAAVELKNLAEEVTKLSIQNAKQAKELLIAQEMAHPRVHGRKGCTNRRGREEVGTWSLDLEDMKMELQARRQREAALEAALAEKEHLEEEYKTKFDEAKKKELSLENDLAGMWVLVAKLKRGALGISDLNVDDRTVNLADITNGTKENKGDKNFALIEKQVSDDTVKSLTAEEHRSPEFEPLLVRLKAKILEMKEKDTDPLSDKDVNSHVCKYASLARLPVQSALCAAQEFQTG
ncbi:kinesin-like protein KIN-7K, chloroplastic isoform X2 [Phragmites australis]|uniref:kinesin-like protein KIN-7K, chloroplastic isoform X2 n=1 Tax=Phragmites australis TaxID=29695 RepID=UPI002D798180|nr:kinesin-like protein KIN-7K, chloroplastic isoform X2 [Phragmites australis]